MPDVKHSSPNVPYLTRLLRALARPPSTDSLMLYAFSLAVAKKGCASLRFDQHIQPEAYRKAIVLWFGEALGLDVETFLRCYGTTSGKAGGASTAF